MGKVAFCLAAWMTAAAARADDKGGLSNDYKAVAAAAAWDYSDKDTDAKRSAATFPKPYKAEIVQPEKDEPRLPFLRITADGKPVFRAAVHLETVFVGVGDVLYLSEHHGSRTGCTLVAFNLKSGKQLWKSVLQGLGPIDHFGYRNRVNLLVENDEVLRVYGNESAGRYVELIDRRTGKTVGHKKFARE